MQRYTLEVSGKAFTLDVDETGPDSYRVAVAGRSFQVKMVGEQAVVEPAPQPGPASGPAPAPAPASSAAGTEVCAPMPGTILSVDVEAGDTVSRGQQLCVLEAMKMKNPIRAPRPGMVAHVNVQAGQSVRFGDLLLQFED